MPVQTEFDWSTAPAKPPTTLAPGQCGWCEDGWDEPCPGGCGEMACNDCGRGCGCVDERDEDEACDCDACVIVAPEGWEPDP